VSQDVSNLINKLDDIQGGYFQYNMGGNSLLYVSETGLYGLDTHVTEITETDCRDYANVFLQLAEHLKKAKQK